MLNDLSDVDVYIACGYTDLRLGIDGLANILKETFELDPFSEKKLFLFCGRKTDRIKGLLWEGDGFLLLYKRLESGRFLWPRNLDDIRNLSEEQFSRLMRGFSIDPGIAKIEAPRHVL